MELTNNQLLELIKDNIGGGGGGGNTTASNGLTKTGDDIKLGGTLGDSTTLVLNNGELHIGGASPDDGSIVFFESLLVTATGLNASQDVTFSEYGNNRDDSIADVQTNVLYTDGSGNLKSAPLSVGQEYTPSNFTPTREFDAEMAGLADTNNVLATLISDLKTKGILL